MKQKLCEQITSHVSPTSNQVYLDSDGHLIHEGRAWLCSVTAEPLQFKDNQEVLNFLRKEGYEDFTVITVFSN